MVKLPVIDNVGTGAGLVFKEETSSNLNRLRSVKAGTDITVTNNADDITIANSSPENTSVSNVGTGDGDVYRDMTGDQINLKTIKAGTDITVTNNADDITIANSSPENTSVSNVGTGDGDVYKDMTGDQINLKTIKAGSDISVTNNTDDITIANDAPENTSVANVGTGDGDVYRDMTGDQINLKTIKAGTNIAVTNNADDVTVALAATAAKTVKEIALTDAATIVVDASLGNLFTVTLTADRTLGAPSNATQGQMIVFRITQDGSGNHTLAYNAIYRFSTDIPEPVLSTGGGDVDYLGFIYNNAETKWDCIGKVFGF